MNTEKIAIHTTTGIRLTTAILFANDDYVKIARRGSRTLMIYRSEFIKMVHPVEGVFEELSAIQDFF